MLAAFPLLFLISFLLLNQVLFYFVKSVMTHLAMAATEGCDSLNEQMDILGMQDESFDEVMKSDHKGRGHRVLVISLDTAIAVFLVALLVAVCWFPARWLSDMNLEREMTESNSNHFAAWPQGKVVDEYAKAQAYNKKIAASNQETLGEFTDPFAGEKTQTNR
ncbi:hypothetical protein OZX57_00755 [Bifidobacterium sp. ESL0682]|uniref:hypothetical protein n=1 Tax=Bifidobacterium sp. ESL0682 TaxID=2983212 RepID=UPI0023F7132A|nr:hypothetical protein [Bifidobacterium sp. ESL0682]WEV42075.1 hypothetical protein OZX57_00755 [Bifidobacterium sp. ESL0682]